MAARKRKEGAGGRRDSSRPRPVSVNIVRFESRPPSLSDLWPPKILQVLAPLHPQTNLFSDYVTGSRTETTGYRKPND